MAKAWTKSTPDNFWDISINTPWKLVTEVVMYLIKPFALLYLYISGVKIGKNSKFYGLPKVYKHRGSSIQIGNNFEARSWWFSNPLGINHPLIICTWSNNAQITIGDDVGISGGSIVAAERVQIGNRVVIGANCNIIDTNFHPTKDNKRYGKDGIGVESVSIGDDVFIGTNSTILKGASIGRDSVIGAGEVVRHG